jgi:hypothetical protein
MVHLKKEVGIMHYLRSKEKKFVRSGEKRMHGKRLLQTIPLTISKELQPQLDIKR